MDSLKDACFKFIKNQSKQGISKGSSCPAAKSSDFYVAELSSPCTILARDVLCVSLVVPYVRFVVPSCPSVSICKACGPSCPSVCM
jgi:hypothetical protein